MKSILTYLLLFSGVYISAQNFQLTSKAEDEKNTPVSYADVTLSVGDSIVKSELTKEDGGFEISAPQGSYNLTIKQLGEILYTQNIDLTQDTDLGTIKIQQAKELQMVTVTGEKKLIERKVDRLVFNVENSVAATGGDALDALKVTPGLRVQNDQISMIGKSSMSVMIDDRLVQLSGEDLTNYLKSIPSDNIKSIEVISNPPAKYEAEGNSGLINIILKQAKEDSWNMTLQESYLQAKYAMNNGGLSFNYNKNKLALSSSLNYGFGKSHYLNKNECFYPDEYWNDRINSAIKDNPFSGRLGLDYKITDKFTIGGQYSLSHSGEKTITKDLTVITGNPDYDQIWTPAVADSKSNYQTANLHGIYKIDSIGKKLSVDLNYLSYKKNDNNLFNTAYSLEDQFKNRSEVNNLGSQNINNYSAVIDMEHPLSWITLNYGTKLSFSKTDNDTSYYDLTSGSLILDPNNTDHFIYKENNEALYLSADKKFGKKWDAKAGLRMEATQTKGNSLTTHEINKRDYSKLFPTAYLSYNFNDNNSLSLSYGRRIERPGFWRLNPFRWYINSQTYVQGDPMLQPSFTHNVELTYTHKTFSTTLYYTRQEDIFQQVAVVNNDDRMRVFSQYNCLNSNSLGWKGNYTFSKLKWWESINEYDINYSEFKSFLPLITDKNNIGWHFYFSTDNTFYLDKKKNFAFNLSWWYYTKGVDQMYYVSAMNELNLAFKMYFLDKNLTVSLKGGDITGSNHPVAATVTNGIKQKFTNYNDTQYFMVSVSYKLGNNKLKTESRDTGNEEEKGRIK